MQWSPCRIALAIVVPIVLATACARGSRLEHASASDATPSRAWSQAVRDGFASVRAATERFRDLDSAVAAGYARDVRRCYSDPQHGAMGFHHVNRGLMDGTLELERPEILLFERHAAGRYTLNGVEYIVPYTRWPADSVPPQIMRVNLARADDLGVWYLHMWVWRANTQGLFAAWNPAVRCPAG